MKVIIVGCGRMGSRLARNLSSSGHKVTVIDLDAANFKLLGDSFKGETIEGVGFDRAVLRTAEIERADAIAAVTSSDEANVVIARLANQFFKVPRVVARLYDVHKSEVYRRLGIQTFDSTSWGVHRVSDLLCYTPLDTVLSMGSGNVEIVEIKVPAPLIGKVVKDLTVLGEIQVIGITRANKTFLPTKGTTFEKEDLIHLAVNISSSDRLKKLLGYA